MFELGLARLLADGGRVRQHPAARFAETQKLSTKDPDLPLREVGNSSEGVQASVPEYQLDGVPKEAANWMLRFRVIPFLIP